jgi:hypothetical protein
VRGTTGVALRTVAEAEATLLDFRAKPNSEPLTLVVAGSRFTLSALINMTTMPNRACTVIIKENDKSLPTPVSVTVWQLGGHGSGEIWPTTAIPQTIGSDIAVEQKSTLAISIYENALWQLLDTDGNPLAVAFHKCINSAQGKKDTPSKAKKAAKPKQAQLQEDYLEALFSKLVADHASDATAYRVWSYRIFNAEPHRAISCLITVSASTAEVLKRLSGQHGWSAWTAHRGDTESLEAERKLEEMIRFEKDTTLKQAIDISAKLDGFYGIMPIGNQLAARFKVSTGIENLKAARLKITGSDSNLSGSRKWHVRGIPQMAAGADIVKLLGAAPLSWNTMFVKNYDFVDPITGNKILCSIVKADASPSQSIVSIMGLTVCIAESFDKTSASNPAAPQREARRARSLVRNISDTAEVPPAKRGAGLGAELTPVPGDNDAEMPGPESQASDSTAAAPSASTNLNPWVKKALDDQAEAMRKEMQQLRIHSDNQITAVTQRIDQVVEAHTQQEAWLKTNMVTNASLKETLEQLIGAQQRPPTAPM